MSLLDFAEYLLTSTIVDGFNGALAFILILFEKKKKQSDVIVMSALKVKAELTFSNISHCGSCHSPNSNVTFSDVLLFCLFK